MAMESVGQALGKGAAGVCTWRQMPSKGSSAGDPLSKVEPHTAGSVVLTAGLFVGLLDVFMAVSGSRR